MTRYSYYAKTQSKTYCVWRKKRRANRREKCNNSFFFLQGSPIIWMDPIYMISYLMTSEKGAAWAKWCTCLDLTDNSDKILTKRCFKRSQKWKHTYQFQKQKSVNAFVLCCIRNYQLLSTSIYDLVLIYVCHFHQLLLLLLLLLQS